MALTVRQRLFCDEYLLDLNQVRAYQAVYKGVKSYAAACASASRLMKNAGVQGYIEERMAERSQRTGISQDRVLAELGLIAFASAADFAQIVRDEEKGKEVVRLLTTDELVVGKRAALVGIKQGTHGVEIRLADKVRALELAGRHLGLFSYKLELSGELGIAQMLKEARERVENADRGAQGAD